MTLPNRLLTDLTSTELVFTSADVDALLRAQGIKAPQRRELTAAALASDEVIAIGRDDGGAVTYTTREILRLRGRLTELTAALHGSRDHAPPQAALDKEIRRLERKARENGRDAADLIGALNHVGDERGLAIFHGAPGTGKSKVLESVARVYDNAGSRLVALAPDRRAAAEMGRDAGVPGRTVAKLLEDLGQGRERLDRDTVVILDEAGMLGLRRMVQLLEHVKDGNAKLIMGGDDRQIPALEAGDPFAAMITQVGGFELTRINRQKDPADKQATTQVRDGAMREALDNYRRRGRIHFSTDADAARLDTAGAYAKWVTAPHNAGKSAAILVADDAAAGAVNESVRHMLKAEGSLHASEEITLATAQGPRAIAVGETLVFRRDGTLGGGKDGPMDVVTGDRARVTELDSRRQTLTLRMGEQEWQVPAHALTHADYGYAQPLRDAQGATVDRAFLLDHPSIHGAYAVVAVSRHREALTIHADASRTPDIASLAAHWSRPLGTTKLAELSNPRPTPFLLARQQRMQR